MVNWNDPTTQLQQYEVIQKLQYALWGAFIWDSTISLKFDAEVLWENEKRSSFAWAKWVYLGCKYTTMTYYVTNMVDADATEWISCELWVKLLFTLVYLSASLASSLIGIRAIVIWEKDKKLIILVVLCLLSHLALSIRNVTEITAEWLPDSHFCYIPSLGSAAPNLTAVLVCDTILLSAVLVGLVHKRFVHKRGIGYVLWRQGLVWAALAILAEVLSVVFIYLNLNSPMNMMSSTPASFILPVCAIRMYRSLFTIAHHPDKYLKQVSMPIPHGPFGGQCG